MIEGLFGMIEGRLRMLLADRSYDADAVRAEITFTGTRAIIPAKRGRRAPALHSQPHYTWRNWIERMFNKLKNWRRITTRYDKTAAAYLGYVSIPSAGLRPTAWCRSGVTEQRWLRDQAARGGRLTVGSSPSGAMVSRVM